MPRISCIMPTCDRPGFVPVAISYFLRQDFQDAELIIVDDGAEPVQELVPSDQRVRYVRLPERRPVGSKRNLACDIAQGELIAHWDDDDWYSPDRLRRQAGALADSRADLCGVDTVLFYDVRSREAWRYTYPRGQRPWLAGNSLMYRRSFWRTHRFAEVDVGEDSRFVWSAHPRDLVALSAPTIHVGVIHDHNVSAIQANGPWWQPLPADAIRSVLGNDWARYAAAEKPPVVAEAADPAPQADAPALRNVYACLVHERRECVIDLVRNLNCLDPASRILLYDGGDPPVLDAGFPFDRYGAVRHPAPRPQIWGKLHGFAIDCMRYALDALAFDTMTIVDSDQLALRPGFSARLSRHLAGKERVGMLGNAPGPQPRNTRVEPAAAALREIELWRGFLRRFQDGERKFVHWTFWPATTFTAAAARDLVRLFDEDEELRDILCRSAIWATEEVILPTLVALLGYEIDAGPASFDYVKYRTPYAPAEIEAALGRPDVFWVHPVPRRYDDPTRCRLRAHHRHYRRAQQAPPCGAAEASPDDPLPLVVPVLERMRAIPGWLEEDEADLLIAVTVLALQAVSDASVIVEIGSHLGRATCVLASVVQSRRAGARVHAVDPHDGRVGALDTGLVAAPSSPGRLRSNLLQVGLADTVEIHHARPVELTWSQPIALLLMDGLHDYASTAQDFFHFEPHLGEGAVVAFHDYAEYFPGVMAFVDELLQEGGWRRVAQVRSMMALQRTKAPGVTAGPARAG